MDRPHNPGISASLVGRVFVHPLYDYLLIGGVLSWIVAGGFFLTGQLGTYTTALWLPFAILLSNSAHFAASTVRLYTKPGAFEAWPFLTMGMPLAALGVLAVCLVFANVVGPHLVALYLTWSPFHYAAQAYGLAVMYSYRSGCMLSWTSKRLLWWAAIIPFLHNFIQAKEVGLHWLLPRRWLETAWTSELIHWAGTLLPWVAAGAAVGVFVWVWRAHHRPMPLIAIMMLITNGIWFFLLDTPQAFLLATIFHGLQYLAIVLVFYVKDQLAKPDNCRPAWQHAVWFYGACALLGYGLFFCLPTACNLIGFGVVESVLLVSAAINIHHFIVDAYIWRFKPTDANRRIVTGQAEVIPAASPSQ